MKSAVNAAQAAKDEIKALLLSQGEAIMENANHYALLLSKVNAQFMSADKISKSTSICALSC